jgi:hypothetical protein
VAQHKVFEDKRAFATSERSPAGAACYLCLSRLRSRCDLDHVVERLAVRAREGNERRWRRPNASPDDACTPAAIRLIDLVVFIRLIDLVAVLISEDVQSVKA